MTSATITIDGKPRGKGRPRFVRATGRTYTDNETAAYERYIKTLWLSNVGKRFDGELYVRICAYYPIPASKPKKTQAAMREGIIRPSVKPDIDNVVKAVLDGLNGVAFKDDNQVTELVAEKWYSDEPCVTVSVMPQNRANEDACAAGDTSVQTSRKDCLQGIIKVDKRRVSR